MTNAHRTIVTLLAVIAVLLAINLTPTAPSQAQGQGVGRPAAAVALTVRDEFFGVSAYRLWADGTVERNEGMFPDCCPEQCLPIEWCGWQEIPELPLIP